VGQVCEAIGHKGLDSINSQKHAGDCMWDGHQTNGNVVCGSRWGKMGEYLGGVWRFGAPQPKREVVGWPEGGACE
jgi:hypothetical protein